LTAKPALSARLASSLAPNGKYIVGHEDGARLSAVIEKIARALWSYETSETAGVGSATVRYAQLSQLSGTQLESFRTLTPPELLPEVGSRMLSRVLVSEDGITPTYWIEVQPGRFSYAIESAMHRVKMVFSEYLAAEVDLAFI
jgi:hypothetical protein